MKNSEANEIVQNMLKTENTESWHDAQIRRLESRAVVGEMHVDRLRINPNNPRDGEWMNDIDELLKGLKRQGFEKSQPLTVFLDTDELTGMIGRGNRRFSAIVRLKSDNPELFAEIFPDGMIPVVMFKSDDLTAHERQVLISDFGKGKKRKELNSYELFLAVRGFVRIGIANRKDIGQQFSRSESWAQKMVALTKLPDYVTTAFKPVLLGKLDESRLRMQDVLIVARDYNNLSSEAFAAEWSKWVAGTHPDGEWFKTHQDKGQPKRESLDYSDIRERRNTYNSKTFQKILDNTNASGFAERIDLALLSGEQDAQCIDSIKAIVGDCTHAVLIERIQSLLVDSQFLADLRSAVTEKTSAGYVKTVEKYRESK